MCCYATKKRCLNYPQWFNNFSLKIFCNVYFAPSCQQILLNVTPSCLLHLYGIISRKDSSELDWKRTQIWSVETLFSSCAFALELLWKHFYCLHNIKVVVQMRFINIKIAFAQHYQQEQRVRRLVLVHVGRNVTQTLCMAQDDTPGSSNQQWLLNY